MTTLPPCNPSSIIANAQPTEGPKVLPYLIDLNVTPNFEIDLQDAFSRKFISGVQSCFVDNTNNTAFLQLTFNSQQVVIIPPGAQGYVRLLVQNPPKISGISSGTSKIELILLNFPTETFIWNKAGILFTYTATNELRVSDAALEASIVSGKVQSLQFLTGDVQTPLPEFAGDKVYNINTAAAGNTAIAAAAGVGVGYYIKEISVKLSGDASLAVAGQVTISIREAAVVIATQTIYLPAAAPNTPGGFDVLKLSNLNYNFKTANVALNVNLSAALATGVASVIIVGGTTTIIGP